MEKIPTVFERDPATHEHHVVDRVRSECGWVTEGFGIAVEKVDGENVRIINRELHKRQRPADGTPYTRMCYQKCSMMGTEDVLLRNAFERLEWKDREDAIYEAVGPGLQGNPYNLGHTEMVRIVPPRIDLIINEGELGLKRTFEGIRGFLKLWKMEGIVFRHPDGRMAKIKRADYGLPWPLRWEAPKGVKIDAVASPLPLLLAPPAVERNESLEKALDLMMGCE